MPPKTSEWTQARMQANGAVKSELEKALNGPVVNHRPSMDVFTSAPWRTGAISSIQDLATWVSDPASRQSASTDPDTAPATPSDFASEVIVHVPGFSLPSPKEWTVNFSSHVFSYLSLLIYTLNLSRSSLKSPPPPRALIKMRRLIS